MLGFHNPEGILANLHAHINSHEIKATIVVTARKRYYSAGINEGKIKHYKFNSDFFNKVSLSVEIDS